MLVRRMLMLAAVLMAVTAVTVALAPRDAERRQPQPSAGPVATPAPSPPDPGAAPPQTPVERDGVAPGEAPVETMLAEDAGQVVRVAAGDVLRLRVVSEELETVQLGADGPIDVADRDSPAEFDVLAEAGEAREVRLLESGRTIGRLVTQP